MSKKSKKADRTPLPGETQEQADRRADDQDAAMEAAFLAGTLPDEDRREEEVVAVLEEVPEPDGSEVPLGTADAGQALFADNATTPAVKTGQHTPPAGSELQGASDE